MAEPINFPGANIRMNAPEGQEDKVSDIVAYEGGCNCGGCASQVITCWRLRPEELEQVKKTGVVWLYISGSAMPPAYIGTENPFPKEPSDDYTNS